MIRNLRTALVASLAAGVFSATGCLSSKNDCATCGGAVGGGYAAGGDASLQDRYNACVDPCWPERYNYQARQPVIGAFANQVANGHALDQTLFNGDFESGSDRLTPGGLKKLDTLSRRRPVDGRLFVQTSRDLQYDPANAGKFAKAKAELDAARADAVQAYLAASTSGRNVAFEVAISDPQDMTMPVIGPMIAVQGYAFQHQSGISGIAGNGLTGGAGGANFIAPVTGGTFGGFTPGVGGNTGAAGLGAPAPNPAAGSGANVSGGK